MRTTFLTFIILCFSLTLHGAEIKVPLQSDALKNTSYSFYAKYVDGENILAINPELRLTPGSLIKLFTTAAALEYMGPEHKFKTEIYFEGKKNIFGTLKGNVYIKGGGDPALGSNRIKTNPSMEEILDFWASRIESREIKKIDGDIIADISLFSGNNLPPKTAWEDMGNYFGATSEALNFNDNMFRLCFKPQTQELSLVEFDSMSPQVEGISVKSYVATDPFSSSDEIYIFAAPGQFELIARGTVPVKTTASYVYASLPDPPLFTAQQFKNELLKRGIKITGEAKVSYGKFNYTDKTFLASSYSPALFEIINIINKKSFNLYSEVLLKNIAVFNTGTGSTEQGIVEIENFLRAQNNLTDNFKIYDGSGLSRNTFVNTKTVITFLENMTKKPYFEIFYNSLLNPAEEEKHRLKNAFLNSPTLDSLHMKTGFLTGVRAYSGYIKDYNGKMIAFSFIVNNYTVKTNEINKIFEDILTSLSNIGRPPPVTKKTSGNIKKQTS